VVFTVVPKSAAKVSRGAKPLQKRAEGGEGSARLKLYFTQPKYFFSAIHRMKMVRKKHGATTKT